MPAVVAPNAAGLLRVEKRGGNAALTAERLRELLDYSPTTGAFHWRVDRGLNRCAGKPAGYAPSGGYVTIYLDGKLYKAHRLAWLHVTGSWPSFGIDHIDGERSNNRFDNLRDVPHRVNVHNQRRARTNNATGLLGVYRKTSMRTHPFAACIGLPDGTSKHLGYFATAEKAHAAYVAAKRIDHREGCTL